MKSAFTGFSEEDLKRIKSGTSNSNNDTALPENIKKYSRIGGKTQRPVSYKLPALQKQYSDETSDLQFEKCRLSLAPVSPSKNVSTDSREDIKTSIIVTPVIDIPAKELENCVKTDETVNVDGKREHFEKMEDLHENISRKSSLSAPDIVKEVSNYIEDEPVPNKLNIEELQFKQKLIEEQNKKRKEMLAKALADRTRQTEEEVLKLEKIKKELQVLDGQFYQEVSVLRKKIDIACLNYAEAEKHYLKVEKEFLQAKINLQKEKEKKELLTEHLCALITHNETRKAQKLETLMLELASDKKNGVTANNGITLSKDTSTSDEEEAIVIDGVCQKTGKFVDVNI